MVFIDIKQIREELDTAKNPLYFFDDDPDGLCSFLLFYRYVKEGKGIIIKTTPRITTDFLKKVEEYNPDKIFILDIAVVDQEFLDSVNVPIIWIDHHTPVERDKVMYHNPRLKSMEKSTPTSQICYNATKKDLWLAMTGIVADWHLPKDIAKMFSEKYPELLPKSIKKPEEALFSTELGKLAKIFALNLKGKTQEVMKSVKILTRIDDPYEILNSTTPRGKFIYKRYDKLNQEYEEIKAQALKQKSKGNMLVFLYPNNKLSITKELSNEIYYKNPDKVVIIGRTKNGEVKMSIRARDFNLPPILEKALQGVEGFGGGHEHACGAVVKEQDFDVFLKNIKNEIKS